MMKRQRISHTLSTVAADLLGEGDALVEGDGFTLLALVEGLGVAVLVALDDMMGMFTMLTPPLEMRNYSQKAVEVKMQVKKP